MRGFRELALRLETRERAREEAIVAGLRKAPLPWCKWVICLAEVDGSLRAAKLVQRAHFITDTRSHLAKEKPPPEDFAHRVLWCLEHEPETIFVYVATGPTDCEMLRLIEVDLVRCVALLGNVREVGQA